VAEEHLLGRINDINRKSYEPFVMQLGLRAAFSEASDPNPTEAQDERLAKIDTRLEAVRTQAVAPRSTVQGGVPLPTRPASWSGSRQRSRRWAWSCSSFSP